MKKESHGAELIIFLNRYLGPQVHACQQARQPCHHADALRRLVVNTARNATKDD